MSKHGQAIRIGVLFSQEGVMAVTEQAMLEGVMLAIAEINEGGGFEGRPLSPVVVNSGAEPQVAAIALHRLVGVRRSYVSAKGMLGSGNRSTVIWLALRS